jgi:hypothetical protein
MNKQYINCNKWFFYTENASDAHDKPAKHKKTGKTEESSAKEPSGKKESGRKRKKNKKKKGKDKDEGNLTMLKYFKLPCPSFILDETIHHILVKF